MNYLYADPSEDVPAHLVKSYEARAAGYWNLFYQGHKDKFYKDRHYLDREFKALAQGPATVLEVGCGAGNTLYPLLEVNPELRVYACDFAPAAVQLVKEHPAYATGHASAFVADLTRDDLCASVPAASVDYVTMVFVLSAVSPEHMPSAVANIARTIRARGQLFFRDYAEGDLTQERRQASGSKRLGDRFYLRGDGTRCYYFQEQELVALFAKAGLACLDIRTYDHEIENRKRDLIMSRRWVQAVFQLQGPAADVEMSDAANALMSTQQQQEQQQQQQQHPTQGRSWDHSVSPESCIGNGKEVLPLALGKGWLSGAAGRLASCTPTLPGIPSGRALLPDTLDSADECAETLSPDAGLRVHSRPEEAGSASGGCNRGAGPRTLASDMEKALEAEFFATVQRDTQDVVSQELATVGLAGITLAGPESSVPSSSPLIPAQQAPSVSLQPLQHIPPLEAKFPKAWPKQQPPSQQPSIAISDVVTIAPRLSLSRHWPQLSSGHSYCRGTDAPPLLKQAAENEVLLANLIVRSHLLQAILANAQVLQMAAGPGAVSAAAAVRVGAKRVLVTHPERAFLACLASSLHENRSKLIIERLRVAQLALGGDAGLMRNAMEQAFPPQSSSYVDEQGQPQPQPQAGKVVLCADLSTAVAAEVACMQAQRGKNSGHAAFISGSDSDVGVAELSSQALLAVLRGAWQLANSGAEPGERGKLRRTVYPRNLTHTLRAAGVKDSSCSSLQSSHSMGGVLLLLVCKGQESGVASAAGACGWRVDADATAALLQCVQGDAKISGSALLLRS
ncbi:hypothetical protein DUNSADRAFT_9671 [Dunaliella salina]|uniref:Methyltransferase type 12 domain-containing protein n=1 Tax=Dunaliella salina TaxID=3046 RepID=A0ABQ7GGZ9_DUNSA|nr:hypothetical protein DUNSADRAFT_9671 [Dunaliella salina]|eukprot:KAF5833876.1 hypothetical protein DUNSADRAFT_9671 [Dunaliella salina]